MNYRLTIGTALCLLGVLASFALSFWFGARDESLVDQRLAEVRRNITALLGELRVLQSAAPKSDLDAIAAAIGRTQSRSTQLQGQLSTVQTTLKAIPQSISGGLFRSGFSWNKDATLGAITTLQNAIGEMSRDISEASSAVDHASLALLDITRRTADLESRLAADLEKMDDQRSSLSELQKLLRSLWMPPLLALVTVVVGLSTIWVGWRKDRREAEALRFQNDGLATVTPISAPAPKITAEQTPTG